jgi:hypothetical protein
VTSLPLPVLLLQCIVWSWGHIANTDSVATFYEREVSAGRIIGLPPSASAALAPSPLWVHPQASNSHPNSQKSSRGGGGGRGGTPFASTSLADSHTQLRAVEQRLAFAALALAVFLSGQTSVGLRHSALSALESLAAFSASVQHIAVSTLTLGKSLGDSKPAATQQHAALFAL